MFETDPTAAPFVWGSGGAQVTPGQLSAQRRIAEAMMQQGMDMSPIRSPWQGINRVAQSLVGTWQAGKADDDQAAATRAAIGDAIGAYKGMQLDATGAPASPGAASIAPVTAAGPPAAAVANTDPGKIYSNDEPSPLDPPDSGAARDMAIRTIVAEAGNQPIAGQTGVAAVLRNRAVDGGYGGDTLSGVIQKPYAFEPWNTAGGRDKMAAITPDDPRYTTAGQALDAAYGTGGRAPADPTEGATHFVAPAAQAALGRPMPSWATGDGTKIGDHVFYSPDDASADPAALPTAAKATQGGYVIPGQDAPAVSPGVQTVAQAMPAATGNPAVPGRPGVDAVFRAMSNPFTPPGMAAGLAAQLKPREVHGQETDASGNIWDVNRTTGQRTVALKKDPNFTAPERDADGNLVQRDATGKITVLSAADKAPTSVSEYKYYKENFQPTAGQPAPMGYDTWSTAKARAGATNISNSVDMNAGMTYDKQLAEGLGKAHAALSNGVEDAQTRARDLAAMQGAVDAIQKNGGTTGGLGQQQALDLKKTINAGLNAIGIDKPFNETDLSDKEFMTKFNRSMAGAQAKNAVGSRVTNFEMSNYLKANPGLDMSITGNQRLIGIQSQIEQRNIAVGNAIREATAGAISQGKKIDPVTVQKIISDYDHTNHVTDPVTGQDLTQNYALPEFNKPGMGSNSTLAVGHEKNIGSIKIKRIE